MHYGVGEGLEFGQVVVEVGGHVPAEVPAEFSCVLEQVELVLAPIEPRAQDLIALQARASKILAEASVNIALNASPS